MLSEPSLKIFQSQGFRIGINSSKISSSYLNPVVSMNSFNASGSIPRRSSYSSPNLSYLQLR